MRCAAREAVDDGIVQQQSAAQEPIVGGETVEQHSVSCCQPTCTCTLTTIAEQRRQLLLLLPHLRQLSTLTTTSNPHAHSQPLQENVDNDDGSCFYYTHDNFFVYGSRGMKNDFGGHDNRHESNVFVSALLVVCVCVCVLSHCVRTVICEGPNLPTLECSSHWSLGLHIVSVVLLLL
jgi:hypothetical protein